MTPRLQKLFDSLKGSGFEPREDRGELTIVVPAVQYHDACVKLRDELGFEQMIDLCGIDYSAYGDRPNEGPRFAVVVHLLSVQNNVRLRVRCFATEDPPRLPSVVSVWAGANWYEREVYDLFGVRFRNHPDLRRIMMPEEYDEGFPLRKDFPTAGKGWRSTYEFWPAMEPGREVKIDASAFGRDREGA